MSDTGHDETIAFYSEWDDPDAEIIDVLYRPIGQYDSGAGRGEDEILDQMWYCRSSSAEDALRVCNTNVLQGGAIRFTGPSDEELMAFAEAFFELWGWDQAS